MWGTISKGFTLIELLIAIAIVAIISAVGLSTFPGAQKRARDSVRQSDLNQYRVALENYASVNGGVYPVSSTGSLALPVPGTGIFLNSGGVLAGYLTGFPVDSKYNSSTNQIYNYFYKSDATGINWVLQACLESGTNTIYRICANGTVGTISGSCPSAVAGVNLCP